MYGKTPDADWNSKQFEYEYLLWWHDAKQQIHPTLSVKMKFAIILLMTYLSHTTALISNFNSIIIVPYIE